MSHIDAILARYQNNDREFLLPILQDIQQEHGFISKEAIVSLGQFLKIPTSKIFAVATFYDQFRFSPAAKIRIQLCHGTACHMEGAAVLLEEFEKRLGIKAGEITSDRLFSLELTGCLGACGMAPVIRINNDFYPLTEPGQVEDLINKVKAEQEA